MAVPPANGAIYLSKIALEKAYDNYAHSSAWTTLEPSNNKISLKHVTIGGAPHAGFYNAGESPEGFEATNTNGPNYPNNDAPYGMQEFLQYDHDFVTSTTSYRTDSGVKFNVLCASNTTTAIYTVGAIANVSTVYTNATRTATLAAGKYWWHGNSNSTQSTHRFETDGSGVVSNLASC